MRFSVITSFFNTSSYVDKQYESLLDQTYQNWEWIVTDDFSDDNSSQERLIEISKKDARVKYIYQKEKKEIFWNPHKYASYESDFILHIGSDDIMYPKTIEVYKHFLMKYPGVSCVVSGAQRIEEDGTLRNYLFSDTLNRNNCNVKDDDSLTELLVTKCWRHTPYPILDFTRENKFEGFTEDFNILTTLEDIGDILCINRKLSDIYVRGESISGYLTEEDDIQHNSDVKLILESINNRRQGVTPFTFLGNGERSTLLYAMYYSEINKSKEFEIINIINKDITPSDIRIIKEIYFDYNITINDFECETKNNLIIISSDNDLNFLISNLDTILSWDKIIIFFDDEKLFNVIFDKHLFPLTFYGHNNRFWMEKL